MRAAPENYKGIEYIQISSLPHDQRKRIYQSLNQKLIINILKENLLMNDCLQYTHYVSWYDNVYMAITQEEYKDVPVETSTLTLAFK